VTSKDKDRKKKKKKAKKEKEKEEKKEVPLTAAGKAVLQRQQLLAEEEARLKKLQEEEEARIKAEEEAEAAREKAIEEEKEKKRKAKQDKVDAQKAAGTYMTKAEKEKAKKQKERLEAMKLSGNLLVPGTDSGSSAFKTTPKTDVSTPKQEEITSSMVIEEVVPVPKDNAPVVVESAAVPAGDDWESGT
jgi:hypothetical protein